MKFKKAKEEGLTEDYVELHYRYMNDEVRQVEQLLCGRKVLTGKKENESRLIMPEEVFYLEIVDRKLYAYLEKRYGSWRADYKRLPMIMKGMVWYELASPWQLI